MAEEKLIVHAAPRARIHLFETQPPLLEGGVTIERFTTRHKVVFEKHTDGRGVVTWYKVCKVGATCESK
jgi:hypothetical protein